MLESFLLDITENRRAAAVMRLAFRTRICVALVCFSCAGLCIAQDIEPRRWTPLPVGMNVFGAGIVYTDGDIGLDPVLEIEDVTVEQKMAVVSYLHAFDLLGKSARFDVRLPYKDTQVGRKAGGSTRYRGPKRTGRSSPSIVRQLYRCTGTQGQGLPGVSGVTPCQHRCRCSVVRYPPVRRLQQ